MNNTEREAYLAGDRVTVFGNLIQGTIPLSKMTWKDLLFDYGKDLRMDELFRAIWRKFNG